MHKECRKKERKDFRKEPEPKAKESHFSKKHPKPHTEKVTYPQFARKFLLAKLWGTFLGVGIIISIITFLSEFDFSSLSDEVWGWVCSLSSFTSAISSFVGDGHV
jgi:hypothetical protein